MSAFNCSKEHFQYLADSLAHLVKGSTRLTEDYSHAFRVLGYDYDQRKNTSPETIANLLVAELQYLNKSAVAGRYNEKPARHEIVMANSGRGGYEFNVLQLIKALNCTMYQCAEAPVIGSEQYEKWEKFSSELAASYVRRLPEYDKASWEINHVRA